MLLIRASLRGTPIIFGRFHQFFFTFSRPIFYIKNYIRSIFSAFSPRTCFTSTIAKYSLNTPSPSPSFLPLPSNLIIVSGCASASFNLVRSCAFVAEKLIGEKVILPVAVRARTRNAGTRSAEPRRIQASPWSRGTVVTAWVWVNGTLLYPGGIS